MNKKIIVVIFIVGIVFSADFIQDLIFKFVAQKAVKASTGLDLTIEHFRLGVLSKRFIDIRGLKLFNPSGFSDSIMVDMPEIYVDYDLGSIFSKKIHIQDMRLELKEFVIVKDNQGVLNLDAVKIPESKSSQEIKIDQLRLKISKIIFKDYSKTPVVTQEYNLNLDEQFQDLDGINAIVRVVMVKAITGTAIKNLIKFNVDAIQKPIASVLSNSTKFLNETTESATKVIKDTEGILKGTFHSIVGGGKAAQPK